MIFGNGFELVIFSWNRRKICCFRLFFLVENRIRFADYFLIQVIRNFDLGNYGTNRTFVCWDLMWHAFSQCRVDCTIFFYGNAAFLKRLMDTYKFV